MVIDLDYFFNYLVIILLLIDLRLSCMIKIILINISNNNETIYDKI